MSWEDEDEQTSSEGKLSLIAAKELSAPVKVRVTVVGSSIYTALIVPLSTMSVVESNEKISFPKSASLKCR